MAVGLTRMRESRCPSLGVEDRLCLLLSRGQLSSEEQTDARKLLRLPFQWPELLKVVYAHETWPLVYRNLRELAFFAVPDAVQLELKSAYAATALYNQFAADELVALLRGFDDVGVSVVPLAGTGRPRRTSR